MALVQQAVSTLLALTLVGGVLAQGAAPAPADTQVNPETGIPESWPDPANLKFDAVTFADPKPQRTVLSNGLGGLSVGRPHAAARQRGGVCQNRKLLRP